MAGKFPVPTNTSSGRKQWKIYRGHRGPFSRLGTELAEDGCPNSQVMYAKQLLEEKCDDELDQEENNRLGVYWLLKASEQGHEEATRMLHRCLETGQGISEHNIGDVKTCLDMPLVEKVSRHAAREIFANLSQGEDFITSDQLSEEMLRVQEQPHGSRQLGPEGTVDKQNAHNDWKARVRLGMKSEKLTEDMLVAAASHYSRGYLPLVHHVLTLHRPSQSPSLVRSLISLPLHHVISSYKRLVDSLAHRPLSSFSPFFFGNLQAVLLFTIYSLFGLEGIFELIPTCIYYGSFFVMLISSCQILSKKWESRHFKQWSNLLVEWGGSRVNPADAQWAHCVNNIRPCFVFLLALLVNLSFIPFISVLNVPHSELAVLSTFLSFIMLYNFMWKDEKVDFLVVSSFGVHLFARYPYDLDPVVSQDWRFLDVHVPSFASYVIGSGVEFCLNFRFFFYLLLALMMVKVASRNQWRGFFTSFVPHCVCLAWWQMAIISSTGATWYGLIRGCLGLFGIMLFLPLAGLSTIVLPMIALVKSLLSLNVIPLPASVILSLASLISAVYLGIKYKTATNNRITWLQLLIVLGSCWLLLSWAGDPRPIGPTESVSWSQYRSICSQERNTPLKAPLQAKCSTLVGLHVSWEGSVKTTSISKTYNPLIPIVNHLPQSLRESVVCMCGEKYDEKFNCLQDSECKTSFSGLRNKCHLANWNRYEYEMVVSISFGGWRGEEETAVLVGSDVFSNLTLLVSAGDRLWFSGFLVEAAKVPRVSLTSAGCIQCAHPLPTTSSIQSAPPDVSVLAASAAKSLLHFLFSPLISFI